MLTLAQLMTQMCMCYQYRIPLFLHSDSETVLGGDMIIISVTGVKEGADLPDPITLHITVDPAVVSFGW